MNAPGTEIGKASIYSKRLAGKTTAAGKPLDASADVAASNSLPLGSKAKVTNLETSKSAVVTVEDRGRLPKGRVDLTPATAQKGALAMLSTVPVGSLFIRARPKPIAKKGRRGRQDKP